jgi:hypothetical protein
MSVVGGPRPESIFNRFSFDFDGTDDYVEVPNSTSLNILSALSISAWFKTTSSNGMYLLTHGSGSQIKYFIQFFAPINRIRVQIFDGSGVSIIVDNTQVFDDGQWHNIILTTDALTTTNGVKVYFDGTLLTNKGTLSNSGLYTTFAGLFIGQIPNTTRFEGNIDEVALFNSELSAGEVTTIYNGGKPKDLSGLSPVSWWRMGDKATYSNPGGVGNWTLVDQGSGGNDGTSNGMDENNRVLDTP